MRVISLILIVLVLSSCRKDPSILDLEPVTADITLPQGFPPLPNNSANPLTNEGIELGRHLFYDERLSGDNSQSCASCHGQNLAFSDKVDFSIGIDGNQGLRNAMPIFNLAWSDEFFWDGRAASLEEQVVMPVEDTLEMHETWQNALLELESDVNYQQMFVAAFGPDAITKENAGKALSQFIKTIISGNSPFDNYLNTNNPAVLGPDANDILEGYDLFVRFDKGDCIHCHTDPIAGRLVTDFSFRNNGLDDDFSADPGLEGVTGDLADRGKFKVPSLRNLSYTAPYMHDGRFNTLQEVLNAYILDLKDTPYTDPVMYHDDGDPNSGIGAQLTPQERDKVIKFLESLNDPSFLTNPDYADPN